MSGSILIVDDEKAQRDILQAILSREGYRTVAAGSGQEALGKLKQDEFDLILTDLKMQGMSGMELLEKVLHDNPGQCVIIMTAHGTIDSAVEATRKGAFNYLEKPLDREHLLFTLQRACEHIALLRENNVRRVFFEADEFESGRRRLSSDLADLVSFLHITGWRWRSEAARLRWTNVAFDAGEVRLRLSSPAGPLTT